MSLISGFGFSLLLLSLYCLCFLPSPVTSTPVTFNLLSHESSCYYVMVNEPPKKIDFYYSVRSGGNFDVDYIISNPEFEVVAQGDKERGINLVFSAEKKGEYSFCFSNAMSTFEDKVIDLELELEGEDDHRPSMPSIPVGSANDPVPDTKTSEEILYRITSELNSLIRTLKFYHIRETRSFNTVKSTERRIWWFAIGESFLIIAMSLLQVYIVKSFFKKGYSKGRL